jgi:hypothetical protein
LEERRCFQALFFDGTVSFHSAEVTGALHAPNAQFCNGASFHGVRIEGGAFFDNAVFDGRVDFGSAHVSGQFDASDAAFDSPSARVDFRSVKIDGNAKLNRTLVRGPVDFCLTEIAGNFEATKTKFETTTEICFSIKHIGIAAFSEVIFCGPVTFAGSKFGDLSISLPCNAPVIPSLRLGGSSVERGFSLVAAKIDQLIATGLNVDGPAYFTDLNIRNYADLRYSHFGLLTVSNSIWPRPFFRIPRSARNQKDGAKRKRQHTKLSRSMKTWAKLTPQLVFPILYLPRTISRRAIESCGARSN